MSEHGAALQTYNQELVKCTFESKYIKEEHNNFLQTF